MECITKDIKNSRARLKKNPDLFFIISLHQFVILDKFNTCFRHTGQKTYFLSKPVYHFLPYARMDKRRNRWGKIMDFTSLPSLHSGFHPTFNFLTSLMFIILKKVQQAWNCSLTAAVVIHSRTSNILKYIWGLLPKQQVISNHKVFIKNSCN